MKEALLVGAGLIIAVLAFLGSKLFGGGNKAKQLGPTEKEQAAAKKVTEAVIEKAKINAKSDAERENIDEIAKMPDGPEKLEKAADLIRDL